MTHRGTGRFLLASSFVAGLTSIVFAAGPETRQQATSQQMYVVCYQFNGSPSTDYYSDPFPDTGDLTKYVNGFETYVDATYHVGKRIPTCVYYRTQAEALAALKQRVSIAKNKVVETHWTPSDSPVPTPVQSPTKGASAKPATIPMFCYATGSSRYSRAGIQAHTYVTTIFPGSATAQPGAAFQTFLRSARRDENIGPGTCSVAPDAETLQGARAEYIATQRKMANRTVVEVDWKGGQ